jgi:hypothetical protein
VGGSKYLEYYGVADQNLRAWRTPEGVGLGSAEGEITKAYGKPSREETATSGDGGPVSERALIYRGRSGAGSTDAFFQIRGGAVSAISLERTAYVGPDCIGSFCIRNTIRRPSSLFQELGSAAGANRTSARIYCYRADSAKAFLRVEMNDEGPTGISVLFLSDFPTCTQAPQKVEQTTNVELQHWKTPEGIGLGSRIEEVTQAYGKPTREDKVAYRSIFPGYKQGQTAPNVGEKALFYWSEGLIFAGFGIRDGRVSYIWLSESE